MLSLLQQLSHRFIHLGKKDRNESDEGKEQVGGGGAGETEEETRTRRSLLT